MKDFLAKYGTLVAGLLIVIFLLIFARNFASTANAMNVLKQASVLSILAVGFTMALITSELDLSFASFASLAAVVTGGLVHGGYPCGNWPCWRVWRPACRAARSTGCWSPK